MSGTRVGSGTWASSAWRTIGASTPSTSSSTALRDGSARSGSRCWTRVAAADTGPSMPTASPAGVADVRAAEWPGPRARSRPDRRSGVQAPAQRGDVAPGDRDLGRVAHDEHRGAVELGAQLDRVLEVDQVGAVHASEARRAPVALELAERSAQKEAPVVADDARVVAVGLREGDRLQAHQPLAAALGVVDGDDVGAGGRPLDSVGGRRVLRRLAAPDVVLDARESRL